MATLNWLSRALARAKVMTFTPANVNIGNTFSVTCNGKSITFTATVATVANVTAGLVALLSVSTIPEFTEMTWVDSATTITATAATAGSDRIFTSSATGGTATLTTATTTAATGPNHWDDVNNWDTGAIPVSTDTVNIDLRRGGIYHGLDQSAVTLAAMRIYSPENTSNGIGLPDINASSYTEYRERTLKISVTTLEVNALSGRIRINTGTAAATATIVNSGSGSETGVPAVLLSGSHASNIYHCQAGSIGLAFFDYETLQAATVNVNPLASVVTGQGATIATMNNKGDVIGDATLTTYNQYDRAQGTLSGAFNPTTINHRGGQLDYRIRGTATNLTLAANLDLSNDQTAKTFTNVTLYPGAEINDPGDVATFSNGVQMDPTATRLTAA